MADDEAPKGSPMDDALWLIGGLIILIGAWFFVGGPGMADLRGIFLSPPQPLGDGGAYGPQFGEESQPSTFEGPPTFGTTTQ